VDPVAIGLPLAFAFSGDPQRDKWTVCTAELISGVLDEPGWRLTVEIASPHDTCYADSKRPEATPTDQYGEETDTPTSEAEDDTADGRDSAPDRSIRSNAQDLWIGLGVERKGRTFPSDPVKVIE
jgi:hypothetical protein